MFFPDNGHTMYALFIVNFTGRVRYSAATTVWICDVDFFSVTDSAVNITGKY